MTVVTAGLSRPICVFCAFREQHSVALLSIPVPSVARISLQCWLDPYLLNFQNGPQILYAFCMT